METAVDHLTAAVAAMKLSRKKLRDDLVDVERQIGILERTLAELRGVAPEDVPSEAPSIRDVALELAANRDRFSLSEVVDASRAAGNDAKYPSISSVLSRMVSSGELTRGPKRGTFLNPDRSPTVARESQMDLPPDPRETDVEPGPLEISVPTPEIET